MMRDNQIDIFVNRFADDLGRNGQASHRASDCTCRVAEQQTGVVPLGSEAARGEDFEPGHDIANRCHEAPGFAGLRSRSIRTSTESMPKMIASTIALRI